MQIDCFLCFLTICFLSLTSSAPVVRFLATVAIQLQFTMLCTFCRTKCHHFLRVWLALKPLNQVTVIMAQQYIDCIQLHICSLVLTALYLDTLNFSLHIIFLYVGDIPLYSTKPAHVIQTPLMTKRDADGNDALHYMIQTTDEMLNITLYPNKKLLSRK